MLNAAVYPTCLNGVTILFRSRFEYNVPSQEYFRFDAFPAPADVVVGAGPPCHRGRHRWRREFVELKLVQRQLLDGVFLEELVRLQGHLRLRHLNYCPCLDGHVRSAFAEIDVCSYGEAFKLELVGHTMQLLYGSGRPGGGEFASRLDPLLLLLGILRLRLFVFADACAFVGERGELCDELLMVNKTLDMREAVRQV